MQTHDTVTLVGEPPGSDLRTAQWPPDFRPAQDLERERERDGDLEKERDGDRPTGCFWGLGLGWYSSPGVWDLDWLFLPLGGGLEEGDGERDGEWLRGGGSRWALWWSRGGPLYLLGQTSRISGAGCVSRRWRAKSRWFLISESNTLQEGNFDYFSFSWLLLRLCRL